MPDDEAALETQDSQPSEQDAAPDGGTPAQTESTQDSQFDPEKYVPVERFTETQAWGTRASQEAAQYRQIIELAQQGDPQAIEWLGLSLAEDDEIDTEDEAPEQFQDPRVDQLLQLEQQRQYEAELDSLEGHVEGEIDKLAKAANVEDLSDEEKDLIFAALTPGQDGNPDVAAAFKKVTGLRDKHIASYVAGKRRPPQAPSGSSPSHQPDLDDDDQRREYILSRIGG